MSRLNYFKEKSIYYSMNAVELLAKRGKRVILAIAGDGPLFDNFVEYADKINKKYPHELIKFVGVIERTPQFLSWSEIVIGIGRCAFEGMATSKPALIVGEKGLAGIVQRENVKELQYYNFAGRNIKKEQDSSLLADTIEEIMDDSKKYKELAEFSREYILENYGYREGARKLEEIYKEVLNENKLSCYEKARTLITNFFNGYCRSAYIAVRVKLAGLFSSD